MSKLLGLIMGVLLMGSVFWFYTNRIQTAHEGTAGLVKRLSAPQQADQISFPRPSDTESGVTLVESGNPIMPAAESETDGAVPTETSFEGSVTSGDTSFPVQEKTVEKSGHRQVFWRPFHIESSARGFAGHVHHVTDLHIEVMEQGPGKYVVAFSYEDEEERLRNINLIEERARIKIRGDDL